MSERLLFALQNSANSKLNTRVRFPSPAPNFFALLIEAASFHSDSRGCFILAMFTFRAPARSRSPIEAAASRRCARTSFLDMFAVAKAVQDRRAPWYLCGLIRKPLRQIGVIQFHDVERRFSCSFAMILGK
jgi:hypothetical protein